MPLVRFSLPELRHDTTVASLRCLPLRAYRAEAPLRRQPRQPLCLFEGLRALGLQMVPGLVCEFYHLVKSLVMGATASEASGVVLDVGLVTYLVMLEMDDTR